MMCQLTKQCPLCSSHIYIKNPKEISDEIVDGRRVISAKCMVCDSTVEIIRKRVMDADIRKFKVESQ